MNFPIKKTKLAISVLLSCLIPSLAGADELSPDLNQLRKEQKQLIQLDLNDLLNLEVTSVSKKAQKVSKSAAAIFVISQQDIKRSGVTSIPEALRMAPGIDVARIDGNKWAITSRGFNSRFANKLLVLIDGRSVYTPFFSGVNWDVQDTLLEDIDRIEVIRGPGGTLWGTNAVNGVINIITKSADQTQGGYAMAGGGSKERVFGGFRYGGQVKDSIYYRLYGKYFERENNDDFSERAVNDDWRMGRGGFRVDWDASDKDRVTVQGDIYEGDVGETVNQASITAPYNTWVNTDAQLAGGNILMRWNKQIDDNEATALQVYYDYTEKDNYWLRQEHNTLDIDFQHALPLTASHNFTWGAQYRFISDDIEGSFILTPLKKNLDTHWFSLFVQDEWELLEDELTLTVGSKFSHNDYSGFEIQPSARIVWTPTANQSIWASVSRAVRTSTRAERGGVINQRTLPPFSTTPPAPLPIVFSLTGSVSNASEEVIAYEVGYRLKPMDELTLDAALFYNFYDNLRNFDPAPRPQFAGTHFVQFFNMRTDMAGESYGGELALTWKAWDNLSFNATYSYLQMQLHAENGVSNLSESSEKHSPHHKFSIRSSFNVLETLDWDMWVRYVDTVPDHQIPRYITLDTRLAWRPIQSLELSVIGQNLLDSQHPEFDSDFILTKPGQVERGVYGKIEWRF